jgi:3-oxoacyl-[acyl-carrier protein] reductase
MVAIPAKWSVDAEGQERHMGAGTGTQALTDDIPAAQAFDLTGRVAVLTGAASGIGKATALILSGAGATVVLGDIDGPGLEVTVKEIDRRGGTAVGVEMDVARRADVDALVARVVDDPRRDVDDVPRALGDHGAQGGLAAVEDAAQVDVEDLLELLVGDVDDPGPTMATYGMTKAAVAQLTKTIAAEGAAHGIRANAIAPGSILSNFSRAHFVDDAGDVDQVRFEAYLEWAATLAPVARVGAPAEVAWMILYLASDAASFVTGQIMRPNGGSSMPW